MELGPFLVLAGLIAGILAGGRVDPAGAGVALVVGAGALAASWFTRARLRLVLAVGAFALIGVAVMSRAVDGQQHSPLDGAIARRSTLTVAGTLVADPNSNGFAASVLARVGVGAGRHRIVLISASGDGSMALRVLEAGDRVTVKGRLAPLRAGGFDDRARWAHAVARLDDADVLQLAPARGLLAPANALRARLLRGTEPLAPTARALTAGFLLGDTRGIPPDVISAYRDSGLSHLLAVSGENVAFVLALASVVLRRLRLGARTAVAVGVIVMFAAMTRFEPSVLRASAMAALALLASFAGRPISTLRVLAYAVIVLLVADPFLLHSVAFLLSCGASAGIALLRAPIARRLPGPELVREPLAVSLAAQVGVMPILLWAFGTFPVVTPLANLVAAPAAEALGVYGLFASFVGGCVPAWAPFLQQPTVLLVGWITTVARLGAAVPLRLDTHGALGLVAVGAVGASVACARAGRPVPAPTPG